MEKNTVSVKIAKSDLGNVKGSALVIGFFKNKTNLSGELKKFDDENGNLVSSYIKDMKFKGDKGETKNIYSNKKSPSRVVFYFVLSLLAKWFSFRPLF